VSYFSAAVVRGSKGWAVSDLDLRGVSDVEDVADRLRDVDLDADISLLFVEIDEEYLVVLRLDEGEDLRVFGSDSAVVEESRLGAVLVADLEPPDHGLDIPDELDETEAGGDDDEDPESGTGLVLDTDPIGDVDLLADLGVPGRRLLAMCVQEGSLPSDVTAEICGSLGCADDVEDLRGA
jgi:putative tRNA adenosine deaminase-associated protein